MKYLSLPLLLVKIALVALAAWLLALYPGEVRIEWLDYRLNTGIEVAIAAVLLFSAAMVIVNLSWRWLRSLPNRIKQRRLESHRVKSEQIVLQALAAVAAGDGKLADKLAHKAKAYNRNNPLSDIVAAQAAHLSGDQKAAEAKFSKLLENSQTEFLGLRGLILQAQSRGDWPQARVLLEKALKHFSNSPWLLEQLYSCNLQLAAFEELPPLIDRLTKLELIDEKENEARKGLLRWLEAEPLQNKQPQQFIKHAERALRLLPGHTHIALAIAKAHTDLGEHSKAFRVLRSAFEVKPHHQLLEPMHSSLNRSKSDTSGEGFYAEIERLAEQNSNNVEALYCLALTALQAKLWGQARKHLQKLLAIGPTKRVFMLLMQLEAQEFPDDKPKQDSWLLKLSTATHDPSWHCSSCAHHHADWQAICDRCHALGTVDYGLGSHQSNNTALLPAA